MEARYEKPNKRRKTSSEGADTAADCENNNFSQQKESGENKSNKNSKQHKTRIASNTKQKQQRNKNTTAVMKKLG
jgi:hypothetical protein